MGRITCNGLGPIEMMIRGRGRYGYLDGTMKRPVETKSFLYIWDAQNSITMAWLINSMEEKIGEKFLCYKTIKQMWEVAKQQYFDLENSAQLFELRDKTWMLTLSKMDIAQYFSAFTKLW